jgi:MFS family permease
MLARWSDPWWKPVLVGSAVTLVFLAVGSWALTVLSAAIAGFLSGRGRRGAVAGIQSAAPVWILWLFVLTLLAPVEGLLLILGGILGPGWGLVVFLFVLIPILLGAFGGMAGGFLAELLSRDEPKAVAAESDPAAR